MYVAALSRRDSTLSATAVGIMEREEEGDEEVMGDSVRSSEFDRALRNLSMDNAPVVDHIPVELCIMGEAALTNLFQLVVRI